MINTTSKEGIRYVEHCRIVVNDERLSLIKSEDSIDKYYSIPYFNLSVLLLGQGTSLTQKAARFLASEGVMVGFTGTGGSPLFLSSQSEYRPTQYFNSFVKKWIDDIERLNIGKMFQIKRISYLQESWKIIFDSKFDEEIKKISEEYIENIRESKNQTMVLTYEAKYTKKLYRVLKNEYDKSFIRTHSDRKDLFNSNLDDGNYLAYGFSSVALWSLGIPASMSVIHGKTRNGGLVFDVADIIKDAVILPHAFIAAEKNISGVEFRSFCIDKLDKFKSLDYIFKSLSDIVI